jgi:hypothetical protein
VTWWGGWLRGGEEEERERERESRTAGARRGSEHSRWIPGIHLLKNERPLKERMAREKERGRERRLVDCGRGTGNGGGGVCVCVCVCGGTGGGREEGARGRRGNILERWRVGRGGGGGGGGGGGEGGGGRRGGGEEARLGSAGRGESRLEGERELGVGQWKFPLCRSRRRRSILSLSRSRRLAAGDADGPSFPLPARPRPRRTFPRPALEPRSPALPTFPCIIAAPIIPESGRGDSALT